MFKISSDIPGRLLRLIVEKGLPDKDSLADFHRQLLLEADKFDAAGVPFDILADLTKASVQTQEVGEDMRIAMKELRERGARKSASIVPGILHKLQVQRLAASADHRTFASEREALAWLRE